MKNLYTLKTLTRKMQSFLAIVLVTLMAVGNVAAQTTYSHTITAKTWSALGAQTLNNVEWTATGTATDGGYFGYDATKGQQFGSAAKSFSALTLSTTGITGTITSVKVNTSGASSVAAVFKVKVGNTYFTSGANDNIALTATATDYTFTGSASGAVSLEWTQTSSKALYIKSIEITYSNAVAPVTVATPTFTPASGTYYSAQSVTIACATEGANIYYTLDGTTPTTSSIFYTGAITVDTTMTIKAIAMKDTAKSTVASATYTIPVITELANLAAFKQQTSETDIFKVNSPLTVIFQSADKKNTFVQDSTAAICIYGTLSRKYNAGDVINGGVHGTYKLYNGMNEMYPVSALPFPAGVSGTPVDPIEVTFAELVNNFSQYEGRLVTVNDVIVSGDHTFSTSRATGVNISQGDYTGQIYNTFKSLTTTLNANMSVNVTGLVIRYNNTVEIAPRTNADIEVLPAELPYVVDFDENLDPALAITNGNYTNKWMVGQAQGFDNNKLFISSSEGVTNKYNISQSSTVTVSREIIIPATGANISFDYRVNGEAGKDFLKVELIREAGTLTLAELQGVNDWDVFNYVVEPQYAGNAIIKFTWVNDNANGEQYPAAIDNISIVPALCAQLNTLQVSVDSTSAHLMWTLVDTTQTNWEVQYKLKSHTDWYSVNATTPELTLTDLQGSSSYDVRVRAICGENFSNWITSEFTIPCGNMRVDNVVAVEGSTPTNLIPFNTGSKNSWNEMIFTAEQMGNPGIINSITLNCATPNSTMTLTTLKIYMANTDRTAHSSNTNWTPQANLTLVYEGTNVQIGGAANVTFDLTTPFNYTGENLALVVSKSASAAVSALTFNTDTARTGATLYRAGAGTAYANYPANATSGAALAGTLNMMLPNITFTSNVCEDLVTCPDLADLTVDSITTSTAMVTWTKGNAEQTNFLLQYKAADATEWTDVQVQDTVYNLTGLDHSTQYVVRVKAICGENDESNYTDEVTFVTPNPCAMVTNIAVSQMSTTTTITWTAGGNETAWQVRFRPTTPEGEDYVIVNVSGIATTTIGGLPGNTEYEYGIKAICDDNESYWAEGTFTTGCDAKDFNYTTEFNTTSKPECWDATSYDFTANGAVAEEAAWLISPAMNVPATGEAFVAFDVKGGAYTLRASYRGTAHNRFATLYEGTASEEIQHVIVPIPELYMDKAVNFALVSEGDLQVTNVEFTTCAYIPSELNVTKSRVNDVDLQWLANGATAFVLEYSLDGTTWTAVEVEGGSDTVTYTQENLNGDSEYQFRVKAVCSGNASEHYSNVIIGRTFCEPLSVPYTVDFSSMPACWETAYTGTNATTLVTTQNGKLVMYNFGTSSQAQIDQVGDLYVILPSFDTTLNRLQLSFDAAKYNNNISSKFYLGVITDINDPSTFYQLNAYNLTSTEATEVLYMLNQVEENLSHGYLAFKMKATDATASQAVVFSNVTVDFIPSCAKPMNLKVVDGSITANSLQLTWTQPTNIQNWDVKYGPTGFDVETEGTMITANIRPRTVSNLTFGTTYDFYVRAHCSNTNLSEWTGPVTVEIDVPYVLGVDQNVTTCQASIYDNGGKTGNYTNNVHQYMVINPIDPTTTVTRLQGNYDLENNYDFVYIYDGTDTTQQPVRTLTSTGTLDITSTSGPLTLVMTSDVSTVKSGFAFVATCEAAPSCSAPKNLSYFNNILSWENGVYGTPQGYEIRYRNTQTTAYQTTTSTTTSKTISGLTVDDTYEFMVRSICGEGDTSEWVTSNIVIPCALKSLPFTENFDSYSSTTSRSTALISPDCWHNNSIGTSTTYYLSVYPSSSYSHSGNNSLRFYNYIPKNNTTASYGDMYAILPAVNANINQLALTGWIRRYSASTSTTTTLYKAEMTVGVTTNLNDPLNPNNFNEITTYNVKSTGTNYEHFDINLSSYSGPEGYLVLLSHVPKPADTATYNYFCVDDILLDYIPECGTPEISLSGSLVTITPSSSLNEPQSYELKIGERTLNIGNVTSYDLATIPNLASNTEYTVKVRAVCSSTSNSEWSNEVSYTTPCIAQEVPYTENFDGYFTPATSTTPPAATSATPYPNHNMPGCWVFPRMSSSTTTYPQYFLTSNSAGIVTGNCLEIRGAANSTDATAAFAVLPALDANLNDLQITFTYRNGSTGATYGDLTVGYMTDYNTPSTFVQVGTTTKTTTKTEKTVSFANVNFTGNNYYIAFKYKGGTSAGNYVYIEDVSVNYVSCLSEVTNLTANVSNGTATVTWQGSADAYDLEYGLAGFDLGQGTRITGITNTTYTINNLSGSYDVYVRVNCGNGKTGPWAHTTACTPYNLPYIEHFDRFVSAPTGVSSVLGEMPACWEPHFNGTTTSTSDYGPKVLRNTSYSPYGVVTNPYMYMVNGTSETYGTPQHPTYVELPQFNQPLNTVSVSFTARISSGNGKLYLGYVSNDEFVRLAEVPATTAASTNPQIHQYNLDQYFTSSYVPSDARLGFQLAYTATASSYVYVGIDDIIVEALPFCVKPQIASVSSSDNSATVVIAPSSNAQSYEVTCVNVEDNTDTHTATANTTDYTAVITGLTPSTTYIVKARAFCGGTDYSDWSIEKTFTTKCPATTLPYSENFDSYTTSATSATAPTGYPNHVMPTCWTFLNMSGSTSSYPQMFLTNYSTYAASGNCMFFKSSSSEPAFAILPSFNYNLSKLRITFTYRNEGTTAANGTLHAGYMTNPDDPSSFVSVRSCPKTTTKTTLTVGYNNTGVTNSNYYIAFMYENGTSQNMYMSIDDILVEEIPYCAAPTVDAVVTTDTSADVTILLNQDAQIYEVVCVPAGTDVDSATMTPVVADNNRVAHITGLTPQTKYDFYARVICDSVTTSDWSRAVSARTQCAPIDVPYTTSFEDDGSLDKETYSSYYFPYCWNKLNSNLTGSSNYYPYSYSTTYSRTGSRCLTFNAYYSTTATTNNYGDNYAVLPEFNVSSVSQLRVNFFARKYYNYTYYSSNLEVGVMTDPTDISTFVKVAEVSSNTATYAEYSIPLNTYTGTGKYIAIRALMPTALSPGNTSTYENNYTCLDDITIDLIPYCDAPMIDSTTTTDSSITVYMAVNGDARAYEAVCVPAGGDVDGENVVPVAADSNRVVVFNGLNASTAYDIFVRVLCDSVTVGVWSNPVSVRTECGPFNLPYTTSFEDDGNLNTVSFGSNPVPYCWNKLSSNTTKTYPYAYASTPRTGARSLYFSTYYSSTATNTYGDNYAVLPEFNVDSVNKLRVKFYARESSTTSYYISHLEVGVMTNPDSINTFVKVADVYPKTTTYEAFIALMNTYTGDGKYIAIKAPKPTDVPEGQTSHYNVTYLDDITVDLIPDCFELDAFEVVEVNDTTIKVKVQDGLHQGTYRVEYRQEEATEWQDMTVSDTVITIGGLQSYTQYVLRAQAVCDSAHSGAWSNEISVLTNCLGGDNITIGNGTAANYTYSPYNNYYKNSWNENIFTSAEVGGSGIIRVVSRKVVATSPFTLDTLRIYMGVTSSNQIQSTTDWIPMENLTLVYEGTGVEIGRNAGWEGIELQTPFSYNGTDNLVVVTAKKASSYVSALTYEYTNLSNVYRNMYRASDTDVSFAEPPTGSSTGTRSYYRPNVRFMLCPYDDDLAIDSIAPISDACDLSAANVTVRVVNKSHVNNVSSFVMTCQLDGTEFTITDSVNRTLLPQESFLYTFNQSIPFVDGANSITVNVLYDLDENPADNIVTLNDIRLVTPATVPYYQDFSTKINFGRDAWVNDKLNNNPNMWIQEENMMKYYDNDTVDAQAYFITSCIEIPAGQYRLSYDYNAMSMLPENMNVYIGTSQDLSSMVLVGQHENFVKTDEDQTYEYIFNNAEDGVFYVAVEALSQRGNMGITFDNLNIVPIVEVTVSVRPDAQGNANGTVSPAGVNYVVYGDDLSISMIPDEMYHVAGIWVDGERVMNEDQYNASFMLYTLEDITEPHTVEVFFKLEFHINKIAVNVNNAYEPGGYFIPAEADTLLDPSAHTVYFAAEPHHHFYNMVVGYQPPVAGGYVYGDDVTAHVVYDTVTNTYSYTLDTLLVANYYVQAMFRRDTININYTALAGDGIFDGQTVAHGQSTDSWLDYGTDFTSSILPADGFYTMNVTVNGEDQGIIDSYDFDSVITTQYVTAQFGHMVTTSIMNINNNEYLGSDEVRGTIAPDTQMVVHGTSCTVTGTVQEHFHLSNFFVNGVDMLADVNMNGLNFSYTIDSLIVNTEIMAVVRIDTIAIYYTVDGGNGYVNGKLLEAPAMDTVYVQYGYDFMSQFAAATGYHIVNVTVNGTAYDEIPAWLTESITEPQYITVTFALNEYDITTAAHGNGTVSDGVHVVYDPATTYVFVATPAVGSHISQIMRNNESLAIADPEATFTDTVNPILMDYSYVAYFAPNIYTVTASCGANGTIDPYGAQSYEYGATPTFTVTANPGYAIEHVYVDGDEVTLTNGAYTFAALTADHTISATFTEDTYTITATAGNGGSITPDGANVVMSGSTVVYTITPATGYEIADVTVDNVSVGAVATYTFENVAANHTIAATFSALQYTITATAGANGTITPAGVNTVAYGATQAFTITPNAGYEVDYVTVDGMEVYLTNNAYTFTNVTANHTIFVAFKAATYTITVTDPANGTITPNGVITVNYGATPTFTVTPNTGYEVTAITVNGSNVIANAQATVMGAYTYTFPAVTANRTLTATMTKKHFTITATAGANGHINGPSTVEYGANATYTITPNAGYLVENVTVDGMSVGAVTTYTFHNVTANHTIHVTFAEEVCVTPTALHVENLDSTSATLVWYHPSADAYDIQYKVASASAWTLVQNVPGFTYNLTNLTPNTYYVFQVKANCSNTNSSAWANAFSFTTPAAPSSPDGINDYVKSHVNVYAEHNRVHIINDYNVDIDNVSIYDMYGKLIYSGNAISNPEVIELNVAVGTYVVRLNTQQGPAVYKVHINR